MENKRVEMRLLNDEERKTSFKEVSLGYNHEEMLEEASRCLNCKNPLCVVNIKHLYFLPYLELFFHSVDSVLLCTEF